MLGRLAVRRAAPAAFGLTVGASGIITICDAGIPSRFGPSVRSFSISSGGIDASNKDDCPVCKKYSQGPCGDIFKKWLNCTDAHPGKDADGEDFYLTKCESLFEPFVKCLELNKDFYEALDIHEEDDDIDEEDLFGAWSKVILDVEACHQAVAFPETSQELQIRLKNNTGMASFSYTLSGSRIVMCYVKDDDTGELLAAGSSDDLWEHDGKGILRLSFGPTCRSVTTYALYSDDLDNDVLYEFSQRLPR
jgi:hypothetical protein